MNAQPNSLVETARRTVQRISKAVIATSSPVFGVWNSPVFVAFDERALYWTSLADAVHSTNIGEAPTVFLVIFDSTVEDATGVAVYIRATARELRDIASIEHSLALLATRRNEKPRPAAEYLPPHTRRVYEAVPERVWTNVVQEADGQVSDERILIDWASISTAH